MSIACNLLCVTFPTTWKITWERLTSFLSALSVTLFFFPEVLPGGVLWGVRTDWERHSDPWRTWENGISSHLPFLPCLLFSAAYFSHCGWIGHLLLVVAGSPRAAVHMRLWVKDAKTCVRVYTSLEWSEISYSMMGNLIGDHWEFRMEPGGNGKKREVITCME